MRDNTNEITDDISQEYSKKQKKGNTMSLLEKLNKINSDSSLKIEDIKHILEEGYLMHRKFGEEIDNFIKEYQSIAKEKGIAKDLIVDDGMLFLKNLVEINYSYCFDDFGDKVFSILPLFFISFEKANKDSDLETAIPQICKFAKEIDLLLERNNLNSGGYVVLGEKRYVPSNLEVSRFVSLDELKKIIEESKVLLNKYLPLFIEDLENFILKNGFLLVLPEVKNKSNDKAKFLSNAIINVENYLSTLADNNLERDNINDIIDSLELLKSKEENV